MRGQDLTQDLRARRRAENKRAFDEIFGDPFAQPEPTVGHYQTVRSLGSLRAAKSDFDEGVGTLNPAAPNIIDFLCDVDRAVETTLTPQELDRFFNTYLYELETAASFTQQERSDIEQRLGSAFRSRHLSPTRKYFTAIRRNPTK